jgi:hypothetical protein
MRRGHGAGVARWVTRGAGAAALGAALTSWPTLASLAGCGGGSDAVAPVQALDGGTDASRAHDADSPADGGGPVTEVLHPDAGPLPGEKACRVTITTGIDPGPGTHLPLCTPVDYPTNPPSGGPHWPIWAAFGAASSPVPREMYVHDMEHGSVVLAYRCSEPCPEVVAALGDVLRQQPADPECDVLVHDRLLLTPDERLDAPIAAAAWGATYVATCIDPSSLRAFVTAHYGRGPEHVCAQGEEATDAGYTSCDAGR